MDKAEQAYEASVAYTAAKNEIYRVMYEDGVILDLTDEAYSCMNKIPEEISQLKRLTTLRLTNTQITDLAPLRKLSNLKRLNIRFSKVKDLSPIKNLTSLVNLHIDETGVDDLDPICGLTAMTELTLRATNVFDLRPISALHQLKSLRLSETPVADLKPLAFLTDLCDLDLSYTNVSDIKPLAKLYRLESLSLEATRVKDISPIKNLAGLAHLMLSKSNVADLRPIAALNKLGTEGLPSLSFSETPATEHDTKLLELAKIDDHADRTRPTLDYLRSLPPWPEPYTPAATPDGSPPKPIGGIPEAPEQDPALPLIWGEKGFAFFAESIATDPVTEAALDDLRDLLDGLRRKGNAHDDLYRIAGELQERSAGEVSDLNMVKLHLSYQKLRRLHKGRAGRDHKFDDETVSQMEAVFDILPGVTLADDNVRTLIERQEAERAAGLTQEQENASARLLEDVQKPDAPFADEVKDVASELLKPNADDRLSGTRHILSRNVVIAVFKWAGSATLSGVFGTYVYNNGADLLAYAATMGDDALFWAQSVFTKFRVEYELAMGITREVAGKPSRPQRKPKD